MISFGSLSVLGLTTGGVGFGFSTLDFVCANELSFKAAVEKKIKLKSKKIWRLIDALPAFAEWFVRKDGDECEKGTLRSSEGA